MMLISRRVNEALYADKLWGLLPALAEAEAIAALKALDPKAAEKLADTARELIAERLLQKKPSA